MAMQLLIFLAGLDVVMSLTTSGTLFCHISSLVRDFSVNKTIIAKTKQECSLACTVDSLCTGFNVISQGNLQCTLGYNEENVTCTTFIKKEAGQYYESCGSNIVS
jgi:hypothetical protein